MRIHVSKWVTSWGFALNLYGDKSPADFIRPCGLEGVNLITAEEVTGFKPSKRLVMDSVVYHFGDVFRRKAKISNDKIQITNKFQYSNSRYQIRIIKNGSFEFEILIIEIYLEFII
jgi:lipoate-protein ligase B